MWGALGNAGERQVIWYVQVSFGLDVALGRCRSEENGV